MHFKVRKPTRDSEKINYSECFQTHQLACSADSIFTNRTVKLTECFLQDKLFPIKVAITNVMSSHRPLFTRKGLQANNNLSRCDDIFTTQNSAPLEIVLQTTKDHDFKGQEHFQAQ